MSALGDLPEKELQKLAEMHYLLLQPDKYTSGSQIVIDAYKAGYMARCENQKAMGKIPTNKKDISEMVKDLIDNATSHKQVNGLADFLVSLEYRITKLETVKS